MHNTSYTLIRATILQLILLTVIRSQRSLAIMRMEFIRNRSTGTSRNISGKFFLAARFGSIVLNHKSINPIRELLRLVISDDQL